MKNGIIRSNKVNKKNILIVSLLMIGLIGKLKNGMPWWRMGVLITITVLIELVSLITATSAGQLAPSIYIIQ